MRHWLYTHLGVTPPRARALSEQEARLLTRPRSESVHFVSTINAQATLERPGADRNLQGAATR